MINDTELPLAILDNDGLAVTAGWLVIYNTDSDNVFTHQSHEYLPVGVGVPALSYIDAPPKYIEGMAIIRTQSGWDHIADHRGETVYSTDTRQAVEITVLGDYPSNTTKLQPATDFDVWDGEKWVTDTTSQHDADVAAAIAEKKRRLLAANVRISVWQTELQLGIIESEDRGKLIAWIGYIKKLEAVDTSTAPDIVWPVMPA
jgi:Caudovirales tail fibre assembly protein, lambda gpK